MTRELLTPIKDEMLATILATDFVQGIRTGVLNQKSRDFYVAQDSYYVGVFAQLLQQMQLQLPAGWQRPILDSSNEADAHLGLNPSSAYRQIMPAEHNEAYLTHLRETVALGNPLASLLALLPCTESYGLIGQALAEQGVLPAGYQAWVDYYTSPAYQDIVHWSWQAVDKLWMTDLKDASVDYLAIYQQSYQHELAFWQAAFLA